MAYKVFSNGNALNASELNTYLMDQSVMVFASTTARDAALTAPIEGMLVWLQDSNKYVYYSGSAWTDLIPTTTSGKIAQVVSTTKTDSFSASVAPGSATSVTGLTATITPTSATSKILVIASVAFSTSGDGAALVLKRDSTNIFIGDAAGNRIRRTAGMIISGDGYVVHTAGMSHLDNPATTSAITYGFDITSMVAGATTTVVVNRTGTDADANTVPRFASSITLLEVLN